MGDIIFPGPDGDYALHLNLELVTALEETGGSLLQVAERLVRHDIRIAEILPLLRVAYRAAGCLLEDDALNAFFLRQSPHALLADLLMGILTPLKAAGAVSPGE